MWSDNETAVDLLGFQHLVAAVTSIVKRDDLLPATIGVFGDWGSGKSSLLEMVKAEVALDPSILVLSFNGWVFEGYEDAKIALMGTILDEILAKRCPTEKAKGLVTDLLKKVRWFRVIGSMAKHGLAFAIAGPAGIGLTVGADVAGYAAQIGEKVKDAKAEDVEKYLETEPQELRRAVRDFRDEFGELMKETKIKTLVVVIDDLDRCTPDRIIETLEAIKLFLFVPGTAFIIGADERLVKYAVRRRFPELPGENVEVGRDYLEKLVQFPVRLPPLDGCEIETYINLLFAKRGGMKSDEFEKARQHVLQCDAASMMGVRFNHGIATEIFDSVPVELSENLSISERIAPVLAAGLNGNPRQCKRFLNMLVMRTTMAASRRLALQQRILAKLMLLEYLRPESFKRLAEVQAAEEGRPAVFAQFERARRQPPAATAAGKTSRDPKKEPAGQAAASIEVPPWLDDPWIREWGASEPPLADVDLRPYFFFSRDILGTLGGAVRRMSPGAQETLQKLVSESEGQRTAVLKEATGLSAADAAAIFEALTARATQEEDLSDDNSSLFRLLDWVEVRMELKNQLITFLGRLPEAKLPLGATMKIASVTKGSEAEAAARQMLGRWEKSTAYPKLARAAKSALSRF